MVQKILFAIVIVLALVSIVTVALGEFATPTTKIGETQEMCSPEQPTATPAPATEAPATEAPATEAPVEEKEIRGVSLTEEEIIAIAITVDGEASVTSDQEKRLVVDTILNRLWDNGYFSYLHTIAEVLDDGYFGYGTGVLLQSNIDLVKDEVVLWEQDEGANRKVVSFWGNHGKHQNGVPSAWHNFFYENEDLCRAEAHKTTAGAAVQYEGYTW